LKFESKLLFLVSHGQAAFIQSPTNEWVVKETFIDCDTGYRRYFTGQCNSAPARHYIAMSLDADRGLRRITVVSAKDWMKPDQHVLSKY
jgi:hypothetical protein